MIVYTNHNGVSKPRNEPEAHPEKFDAEKLFHFTFPRCGVVFGRMSDVIAPPPAHTVRTIKQDMIAEKTKPDPSKPKRARTPAVQADIDRKLAARKARFMPAMKGKGWLSVMKIADKIQCSDDTARTILKRMERDGQVEFLKKSAKEALYRWI